MNPLTIVVIISILGPIIGAAIGVIKKPSDNFVYNMLSFSAGIMLSVSFLELIPESIKFSSVWICIAGIIIGTVIMYIIDKLIPHIHPGICSQEHGRNLNKTATFLILGMFMHNFPEGMAIAVGSVSQFKFSLTIALAIAIHDIPEGISTASTYYHCTKQRLKSFLVSSVTAIPTLLGFIIASILYKNISDEVIGLIIAATAGLMIYICGDELIPASAINSKNHSTIFSLMAGVLVVLILGGL